MSGLTAKVRRLAMRGVIVAAAVLAAGVSAAGEVPRWAGYWSEDPANCSRAGGVGEDTPEYIGPDGIFGLEYSCEIDGVEPIGVGDSWRVDLTCLDAGFEERHSEIFMLTEDDALLRIDAAGFAVRQTRCHKPVMAPLPQSEADCGAEGGQWGPQGLLQDALCTMPTPDAGEFCLTSADCAGACLAPDYSCSAAAPLFGCHDIVDVDGSVLSICID